MSKSKITQRRHKAPGVANVRDPMIDAHAEYSVAAQGDGVDYERMIAEAAYYRAERRGFEPGHELEDWFAAEAEIVASNLKSIPS